MHWSNEPLQWVVPTACSLIASSLLCPFVCFMPFFLGKALKRKGVIDTLCEVSCKRRVGFIFLVGFPFNHHIKTPKLLFMTNNSQNNSQNNNGLITSAHSCASRSNVSVELNVRPLKNCFFIQRCNACLILKPKEQICTHAFSFAKPN